MNSRTTALNKLLFMAKHGSVGPSQSLWVNTAVHLFTDDCKSPQNKQCMKVAAVTIWQRYGITRYDTKCLLISFGRRLQSQTTNPQSNIDHETLFTLFIKMSFDKYILGPLKLRYHKLEMLLFNIQLM